MFAMFDWLAVPLGWILNQIFRLVKSYFIAIFLFTLLTRVAMFPFSLKSQKASADRARLAPRLERLQKKYGQDRQKLQQKTQELYEKEGVSMTGGCLTMLVPMIILFGVIAAIYKPLTHMTSIPAEVINASVTAITDTTKENNPGDEFLISQSDAKEGSYYRELHLMNKMEMGKNRDTIIAAIDTLDSDTRKDVSGAEYFEQFTEMRGQFYLFGMNFLDNPWNSKGFSGINWLWLIPLISAVTALGSSLLSMHYTKGSQSAEQQQMAGCTNGMLLFMPLFSAYIAFIVPGAVGLYWICSNLVAILQTWVLNTMYNPAKIRAQAEIDYQERRARRAEQKAAEKKRIAESRRREELAEQAEAEAAKAEEKPASQKAKKKSEKTSPAELPAEVQENTAPSDSADE